jgi:hypothetical protein
LADASGNGKPVLIEEEPVMNRATVFVFAPV